MLSNSWIARALVVSGLLAAPVHAQSLLQWWADPEPDGLFGRSLAVVGDVDADGVPDVGVGAPESQEYLAGRVDVFSGATGETLWSWIGDDFEQFGYSIAGPGDLDGDGHDDVLVGAPLAGAPLDPPGVVTLYSGRDGLPIRSWTGVGPYGRLRLGTDVAGVGDIDGDGTPDIAATTFTDVIVSSGATGEPLLTWSGQTDAYNEDMQVAGIGDIDGDGTPDVGVGARMYFGPAGKEAGRAYAFSGATGEQLHVWDGEMEGARLGFAIAGGGDFDGDDLPDVVVGAPDHAETRGRVYVFSGVTGEAVWTLDGPTDPARLGNAVAVVNDSDGDGRADLLIGSYTRRLTRYTDGIADLYSGATRQLLARWGGYAYGSQFGTAVADFGDLDGDGWGDVVISADGQYGESIGRVYLMSPAPRPPELQLVQQGEAYFGGSVELVVTGAVPGEKLSFRASDYGIGPGPCIPHLGGICTEVLGPEEIGANVTADPDGRASWRLPLPASPEELEQPLLGVQVIAPRGEMSVRSNPIEIEIFTRP